MAAASGYANSSDDGIQPISERQRTIPVQVNPVPDGVDGGAISRRSVLLVSARWAHLGGHSGLAPLAAALATHLKVDRTQPTAWDKLCVLAVRAQRFVAEKIFGRARAPLWSPFYTPTGLLLETAAQRTLKSHRYDFVLFEALEDHFNLFGTPSVAKGNTKIIAIAHQPPAWWRLYGVEAGVLDRIDTLFVLSREAQRYMQEVMGHRNVHFLPHGVSVGFFSAMERPVPQDVKVVFSGQWLRDFNLLKETIRLLSAKHPAMSFHLVVPKFARTHEAHYEIARFNNVTWYSGLSDTALLALYHSADLMFLPLIDSTANNSLLEAMSTGLPLVVSDVGGVRDYVDEDCAVLISPNTAARAAEQMLWCLAHYPQCREMAARARTKAAAFLSWERFAGELSSIVQAPSRSMPEGRR